MTRIPDCRARSNSFALPGSRDRPGPLPRFAMAVVGRVGGEAARRPHIRATSPYIGTITPRDAARAGAGGGTGTATGVTAAARLIRPASTPSLSEPPGAT